MGREIVYCSQCGDRITSSDLDKGRAAMVLKRYFCKKCVKSVVGNSDSDRDAAETTSPYKARSLRVLSEENPGTPVSTLVPYLIAAGISVVAIALLLFVLFTKHG